MKVMVSLIWLACAVGGLLLGSGLGLYLGYSSLSFITELGLSAAQQFKAGSMLVTLGLMGHVFLGGSLIR